MCPFLHATSATCCAALALVFLPALVAFVVLDGIFIALVAGEIQDGCMSCVIGA